MWSIFGGKIHVTKIYVFTTTNLPKHLEMLEG